MLCGMKTSGTYIPPRRPQTVLIIVAVPFADIVLNVRNTASIEIDEVIIAPIIRATINRPNEDRLTGSINLMLLGSKKATVSRGKQRMIVPESL